MLQDQEKRPAATVHDSIMSTMLQDQEDLLFINFIYNV